MGHPRASFNPAAPMDLSPKEFERLVVEDLFRQSADNPQEVTFNHDELHAAPDGEYQLDGTIRFRFKGLDFLVLIECKRHKSPVKREAVQALADKVRALGAQKGVVVSAAGFQSGALAYARVHGIGLAHVLDEGLTFETRGAAPRMPKLTGVPIVYAIEGTDTGYTRTLLSGQPQYMREFLAGA